MFLGLQSRAPVFSAALKAFPQSFQGCSVLSAGSPLVSEHPFSAKADFWLLVAAFCESLCWFLLSDV